MEDPILSEAREWLSANLKESVAVNMKNTIPILEHPGSTSRSSRRHGKEPFQVNLAETIEQAARVGDLAKVASLVADESYTPPQYLERALIATVKANQLGVARYLLDHGAKTDKPVKPLIHNTPGSYATTNRSLPFLELFMEYGWDINYADRTPTAFIDYGGVTWLLAHGADPNIGRWNNGFVFDASLLDIAAGRSSVKIFNELIAHGARLEDSLALHHAAAARAHDTHLMAHLLELGVDINEPDDKGTLRAGSIGTPIFWAMRSNQIANVKFLVENGADLTVKTPFGGLTPLEHAREKSYTEVVEYLESLLSGEV